MGKNKSCNEGTRQSILSLHAKGWSYGNIAISLDISKTMVFNAIKHFKTHNTTANVPRRARARMTTAREDALIVRESKKFPHKPATEIRDAVFGLNAEGPSVDTVKRRLREVGLFGRIARKKPLLTEKNRKKRLAFAKKYGQWTVRDWKKVLFSDETKINRICSDGKSRVRRPRCKEFVHRYTLPTVKHGGGNIMLWGAMSWRGVGPLHKIEGRMDQFQYTSILNDVMLPYADDHLPVTWIFQQDNDPKHTARSTQKWFADNMVDVLEWPSCSPDLNPIENLWEHVKREVGKFKIGNFDYLFSKTVEVWQAIPPSVCENLIKSMPRRCQAVIRNQGFATKY